MALCFSPGMNRFNCQAAVCNDKIIVLRAPDNRASGFLSGYNLCFTCYLYTPETNEWQMFCAPSIPTLAPEIDSILYSSDKPFFSVFYETFEEPLSETFKSFYVVNVTLCEPGLVPLFKQHLWGAKNYSSPRILSAHRLLFVEGLLNTERGYKWLSHTSFSVLNYFTGKN